MDTRLSLKKCLLLLCLVPSLMAFQQAPSKVQQAVTATQEAYYCKDDDYHTDGKRTVWVKSYKRWTRDDMAVLKKEDYTTLKFLGQAIEHNRMDVLEQLLPDYYRVHGGVNAFAADIKLTLAGGKLSKN